MINIKISLSRQFKTRSEEHVPDRVPCLEPRPGGTYPRWRTGALERSWQPEIDSFKSLKCYTRQHLQNKTGII